MKIIKTSIYLVFKGWLVYQIFFKQKLSLVALHFCSSSCVFRHLYGNFFFDPQIVWNFPPFFTTWAELVPRASRRIRVEEQILPVLGNSFFDILSLSTTIRPCKIKESIKRKQRNSKRKQLVAKWTLSWVWKPSWRVRQPREKLQSLYENLMTDNFRKTALLKKIWIVN